MTTTLDIPREECIGILRRLELESYSNVVSTFRAQGYLNDSKKKILEDLRNVFHIPQERHKAEMRRVANDEKLCTVAEVLCGSNTSQEWSLEGRRSYPLLSRSIAYTAFTAVANTVAEEAQQDNSNFASFDRHQAQMDREIQYTEEKEDINAKRLRIVKRDPYVPVLSEKKKFKRPLSLVANVSVSVMPHRRRTVSDEAKKLLNYEKELQKKVTMDGKTLEDEKSQKQEVHHVLLSQKELSQNQVYTNNRIQQAYHNHYKTVSARHKLPSKQKLSSSALQADREIHSSETNKDSKTFTQYINLLESSRPSSEIDINNSNKINVPNPQILHTYASLSRNIEPSRPSYSTSFSHDSTERNIQSISKGQQIIGQQSQLQTAPEILSSPSSSRKEFIKFNLSPVAEEIKDKIAPINRQITQSRNILNDIHDSGGILKTMPSSLVCENKPIPSVASFIGVPHDSTVGSKILKQQDSSCNLLSQSQIINTDNTTPGIIKVKPFISGQLQSPETAILTSLEPKTTSKSNFSNLSGVQNINFNETISKVITSSAENSSSPEGVSLPKRKIHITNSQIIHPIRINPNRIQRTNLQSRKSIKIVSTSNGRVYVQSAIDNNNKFINLPPPSSTPTSTAMVSAPKIAQIISGPLLSVNQQKNISSSINSLNIIGKTNNNRQIEIINPTAILQNRTGLQKFNIIPNKSNNTIQLSKTNKFVVSLSATTSGNSIKTFSNANNNSTTSTSGNQQNFINLKLQQQKDTISPQKFQLQSTSNIPFSSEGTSSPSSVSLQEQLSPNQSNVIVIGSVPQSTKQIDIESNIDNNILSQHESSEKNTNIITEDTPVYILSSDTNLDNCMETNETENVSLSMASNTLTLPTVKTIEVTQNKITSEDNKTVQIINNDLLTQEHYEQANDNKVGGNNLNFQSINNCNQQPVKDMTYEVTDWEVELDQEVMRSREKDAQKLTKSENNEHNSQISTENAITTFINTDNIIYMEDGGEDNFNDVIEIDGIEPLQQESNDQILEVSKGIEVISPSTATIQCTTSSLAGQVV